ncbi:unnamed protein product, partial [marine sediment metagenome]
MGSHLVEAHRRKSRPTKAISSNHLRAMNTAQTDTHAGSQGSRCTRGISVLLDPAALGQVSRPLSVYHTRPGWWRSHVNPLTKLLAEGHKNVKLDRAQWRTLCTWI